MTYVEPIELSFYEELCHDLKTPISIVFAYLQLLERMGDMPAQAYAYLDEVKRNCYRMAKLIYDANDGVRINKGMVIPKLANLDVVQLTRDICDNAQILAGRKRISIRFVTALETRIMALDKLLLERILLNLLANAKQFSPEDGEILVSLWEKNDSVFIAVRDYGQGVSSEMAGKMFARNVSGSKSGLHSGLGLYIVKELTALLGGEVCLSEVSPGLEVVVGLPAFFTDVDVDERPVDDFFVDNMVQLELLY